MLPTPQKEPISNTKKFEKTTQPIAQNTRGSLFSIEGFLQSKEEESNKNTTIVVDEKLPKNHFTETDVQTEWKYFLDQIKKKDTVTYNAISVFKIAKKTEDELEITYSSESAREEFDKCKDLFVQHFKQKVHHYSISIVFKKIEIKTKVEVMTKRSKFEKLAQQFPLLRDLDAVMKFDFS